jgi:hypothetical protein
MVEMANAVARAVTHPIAYVHMPVPVTRTDEDYFRPLRKLALPGGAELYLGLVHAADGVAGTRRRIEVARKFVADFGIATECGIARARTDQVVHDLLRAYADASQEPAG